MSSYDLLAVVSGKEKRLPSSGLTMDFTAVRIGASNLSIAESSGAFDFGAVALKSTFVPVADADLVNKLALDNAIASLASGTEWQDSVLSRATVNPGGDSTGDRYLVIATATGAFAGQENKIAEYNGSTWDFTAPTTGMAVLVDDEPTKMYVYGSSSWGSKSFESTTASGFLAKTGDDITLKNLTDGQFIVGNVSNIATAVTMSGDITMSNAGVTAIGASKVTNAMLAGSISDDKLNQITTANKVAGSAVQLASNGGLKNDTGLKRDDARSFTNDNAGAITIRQLVYIKANGNVDLAQANVSNLDQFELGLVEDASIASAGSGKIFMVNGGILGGFTALTPGAPVYVSRSSAGGYQQDLTGFVAGEHVYEVGRAISATEVKYAPKYRFEY